MRAITILLCLYALNASAGEVKILQFNAWQMGILDFEPTKDRLERLKLTPSYVADTNADVIAFTEVWKDMTKARIARDLKSKGYPYSYFKKKLIMGDGLLLVSKYPITEIEESEQFTPSTGFFESLAAKRARKYTISLPNGLKINLVQAHLGAIRFDTEEDAYDEIELDALTKQFDMLAAFIRKTTKDEITILAADLNFHYQEYTGHGKYDGTYSAPFKALVENSCRKSYLENSFLVVNRMTEEDPAVFTYDSGNPYVKSGYYREIPNETEDYILNCRSSRIKTLDSRIVFKEPLPESDILKYKLKKLPKRLSDHYGVFTTFEIN